MFLKMIFEASMLQVNRVKLTGLREGTQHDDEKEACITLYGRAFLGNGSEMMKTSPVTGAGASDPNAELFRVITNGPPCKGAVVDPREAADLLQDCTS